MAVSDEIRTYIDGKISALEGRVRLIENSNAASTVHHENVEKRLSGIENSITWLIRIILGAIVLSAIAALGLVP